MGWLGGLRWYLRRFLREKNEYEYYWLRGGVHDLRFVPLLLRQRRRERGFFQRHTTQQVGEWVSIFRYLVLRREGSNFLVQFIILALPQVRHFRQEYGYGMSNVDWDELLRPSSQRLLSDQSLLSPPPQKEYSTLHTGDIGLTIWAACDDNSSKKTCHHCSEKPENSSTSGQMLSENQEYSSKHLQEEQQWYEIGDSGSPRIRQKYTSGWVCSRALIYRQKWRARILGKTQHDCGMSTNDYRKMPRDLRKQILSYRK